MWTQVIVASNQKRFGFINFQLSLKKSFEVSIVIFWRKFLTKVLRLNHFFYHSKVAETLSKHSSNGHWLYHANIKALKRKVNYLETVK